jgi:DNA repair protein RadC
MPNIKELPQEERPREKLYSLGREALSNAELLAVLMGSGSREKSALDLAMELLSKEEGGIRALPAMLPEEMEKMSGIGEAKACRILAAIELGSRIAGASYTASRVTSPEEIANIFQSEMRDSTKERFAVLMLNVKGIVIGKETVSVGNINSSIVDPREVFKPAIKKGAASLVLVHNHPSGDPEPSKDDIAVTDKIVEAGKLLDIRILDHLIIGKGSFVSLRRRKLITA